MFFLHSFFFLLYIYNRKQSEAIVYMIKDYNIKYNI